MTFNIFTQAFDVDKLTPLMTWLEDSAINDLVLSNAWLWPALESFHFLGLCLLFGSLLFVDLRVLGVAGKAPLKEMHGYVPYAIAGFSINLITGLLFVFGDPFRYFPNIMFQLKMITIFLAGLNLLYFELKVHPKIKANQAIGADAKIAAALSLVFWAFVIVAGRMIPYFEY